MSQSVMIDAGADELVLVVRIGGRLHALPVASIEEVLPALPIEPLPQAGRQVKGVVFVRGHLIPVLDTAAILGLSASGPGASPEDAEGHLVCVGVDGRLLAIEVDEAIDLADLGAATRMSTTALAANCGPVSALIERDGDIIHLLVPARLAAACELEGEASA